MARDLTFTYFQINFQSPAKGKLYLCQTKSTLVIRKGERFEFSDFSRKPGIWNFSIIISNIQMEMRVCKVGVGDLNLISAKICFNIKMLFLNISVSFFLTLSGAVGKEPLETWPLTDTPRSRFVTSKNKQVAQNTN